MSREAMKLALEAAYLAGFKASGEGYNGEYPFQDHNAHPAQDEGWCQNRDAYIRETLVEQPAQDDPDLQDKDPELVEQPVQQEPVADKHQAFIDSLPSDMEDKMFEQIHYWARQSYARHQQSTRGQTITAADSSDNHIIWAALRWAKENAATPPAQRKPLPQGEWPKHPSKYVGEAYVGYSTSDLDNYAMQVLSAHGIEVQP